jgi:hypothetical protein
MHPLCGRSKRRSIERLPRSNNMDDHRRDEAHEDAWLGSNSPVMRSFLVNWKAQLLSARTQHLAVRPGDEGTNGSDQLSMLRPAWALHSETRIASPS